MARSEATSKTTVPVTVTRSYSVELWPRNTARYESRFHAEVQATSKQEAINKAISEHPGHAWGIVRELGEEAPAGHGRTYAEPGTKALHRSWDQANKQAHEGSKIRDVDAMPAEEPLCVDSSCAMCQNQLDDSKPEDEPVAMQRWDVVLYRSGFEDITIRLVAKDKQQVCQKAIKAYGSWNVVRSEMVQELAPKQPGLWERPWTPTIREDEDVTLNQIVTEAIGTGSVCWDPKPEGIFDSEMAAWVMGGAVNAIEKLIFAQTGFTPGGQKVRGTIDEERFEGECAESEPCIGEASEPTLSDEDKQRWLQRLADKAAIIDLILSYRHKDDDEAKLRQIRVVME